MCDLSFPRSVPLRQNIIFKQNEVSKAKQTE